jgi:CRISPR-associated endoribonuclease Cas6
MPQVPPDSDRLRLNRDIPRPFVIKPPLDEKEQYRPGDRIMFDLVLAGRAIDLLPYLLVAFKELGESGVGTGRGRFRIQEVEALDASGGTERVWAGESNLVHAPQKRVMLGEIDKNLSGTSHSLRLHFLTPVLLKDKGQWVRPFFGPLMRRLRDRIHALSYFYCGETLEMDFDGFGESADRIESKPGKMEWVEETRYAKHRQIEHPLMGYKGVMEYEGDLTTFWPFLLLGEYVHVGKAVAFGQGWYKIEQPCEESEKGACGGRRGDL